MYQALEKCDSYDAPYDVHKKKRNKHPLQPAILDKLLMHRQEPPVNDCCGK